MSSPDFTFTSGPRFERIRNGVRRAQENAEAVPLGDERASREFRVVAYALAMIYGAKTDGWEPVTEADFSEVISALTELMGSLGNDADLVPPLVLALLRRKEGHTNDPKPGEWRKLLKSGRLNERLPLPATAAESEQVLKRLGFVFVSSIRSRRALRYEGLRHGQVIAAIYSAMHSRRFHERKAHFEVGNEMVSDYLAIEMRVAHSIGVQITLEYPDGRIVEVNPEMRALPVAGQTLSELVRASIEVPAYAR